MAFILRPLAASDYETAVALLNSASPERSESAEAWRDADQNAATSDLRPRRYVATDADAPIVLGYASIWPVRFPKFRMDLAVDARWRRQGLGGMLLQRLLVDLAALNAMTIQARAREDRLEALAFLTRRGFVETQRMVELRLDLEEFDLTRLPAEIDRIQQRGIVLITLAEERERTQDHAYKLYELQSAVAPSWPDPDPTLNPIPQTYEEFLQEFLGWRAIPDAFFIAKLGEQYIGYSGLACRVDESDSLDSAGTAVRPEYRRQGIAYALKMLGLQYARQRGYSALVTRSGNPAMIALNEKLGFRRGLAEVRLVRQLQSGNNLEA